MNFNFTRSLGATALPASSAVHVLLRHIVLDIAHKIVRRRKRTRSQITCDYDQGAWRAQLMARRWEQCRDLAAYVVPEDERMITATVEGELTRITLHDYYAYRTKCIADVLEKYAGNIDHLVEIGSGAGQNLFSLSLSGRWLRLRGLELSETGIEVIRLVSEHFGLRNVSAGQIDLLDPNSPGFATLHGATAFSFYCLEQLPDHTEAVLTRLVRAGIRRVIHMEPTPELFSFLSLRDIATITYIWRQHYLNDLVATTRRLERRGLIRIVTVGRLGFAPTVRNAPTLVVWEPAGV